MQAIRITQKLDSDTIYLPQLSLLVGQEVEIIVLSNEPVKVAAADLDSNPLAGSVLRYDDPFEAAVPSDEWESNR